MNRPMDAERILDAYLAPEDDRLAGRVLESALAEIARTPQRRRLRLPWAYPVTQHLGRMATVALVAVVAVGGVLFVVDRGGGAGGPPATPMPTINRDLKVWIPYNSAAYSYTMAYPNTWTVDHFATRKWDAVTDGLDPSSPGVDTFTNEARTVTVSRWRAPHEPNEDAGGPAWIAAFCLEVGDQPCTGIFQRAATICPESCASALGVPFQDHVMAFYVDTPDDTVNVVVVWLPETDPALAAYGGATNLLRAFVEHGRGY